MSFKSFIKILLFLNLIFQVILDDDLIDYKKENNIEDMRTGFLSGKKEKFYNLGSLLEDNHIIIGFSDLNSDKLTDIITYKKISDTEFEFYLHEYTKKSDDDDKIPKFKKANKLFSINVNITNATVRNLHVFDQSHIACYLVSFNIGNDELLHYIYGNNEVKLNITSNILILNQEDNRLRFLYYDKTDKKRKICRLDDDYSCKSKNFEEWLDINCYGGFGRKFGSNTPISLKGGLAYVDIDGNCSPDIILSHDEDNENGKRYIEIYTSNRTSNNNYCLLDVIELENKSEYGPFSITKINDDRNLDEREKYAPLLDIVIPLINKNQIKIFKNKKKIKYSWSHNYCEDDYKESDPIEGLFEELQPQNLTLLGYDQYSATLNSDYPTILRVGDFLGTSNPGILVAQNLKDSSGITSKTIISLFKRENGQFTHFVSFDLDKIPDKIDKDQFKMGLFFDIDETGTLSVIIPTVKGKNYFFFNYRRNIYFVKSKLMNYKERLYDVNLGATYRYIVTDKSGNRHMDVWYQLSQTSDMNIPLPYSLVGLDDTNNYVEYFQTISGNYLDNQPAVSGEQNWKVNSPIIPNTQMMILKFINPDDRIEWTVDLIVQPMDEIWLFLLAVVIILLIVLAFIIYFHVKELKEEQKETTKFKSWFA